MPIYERKAKPDMRDSLDTRSGWGERQLIRGPDVSNCLTRRAPEVILEKVAGTSSCDLCPGIYIALTFGGYKWSEIASRPCPQGRMAARDGF